MSERALFRYLAAYMASRLLALVKLPVFIAHELVFRLKVLDHLIEALDGGQRDALELAAVDGLRLSFKAKAA